MLLVVWPESLQHWNLQAVWWDQVLVLMSQVRCQPSDKCSLICLQLLYLKRESQSHPPPPNETLQDQQVGLAQDHMKSLLLPWILGHMEILCISSKSRVFVPLSPVKLL